MEVDVSRKRIGLSMRMKDKAEEVAEARQQPRRERSAGGAGRPQQQKQQGRGGNRQKEKAAGSFADLFANAKKLRK